MVMGMCRKMGYALLVAILLLAAGTNVWGQDVTASITGTVTDSSGAPIAGALVTAKSVERGTAYTGTSSEEGYYRITQLPVGNYDLRVEKTGFQTALHPAFTLVLNQI